MKRALKRMRWMSASGVRRRGYGIGSGYGEVGIVRKVKRRVSFGEARG